MTPFQHFQICLSLIRFYSDKLFVGFNIPTATIALSQKGHQRIGLDLTQPKNWVSFVRAYKITFSEYGSQIYPRFTDLCFQN